MSRNRLRADVVVLGAVLVCAVSAPWIAPFDPSAQLDISALRNGTPSWTHLLGTDPFSRDLLSRALFGARTSVTVAFLATACALLVGTAFGMTAASLGPRSGPWMMSLMDVVRSVPRMLLLLAVVALAGTLSPFSLALLLGLLASPATSRLVHAQTRQLLSRDFVDAAVAIGASRVRVLQRHVAPHLVGPLTASGALLVADLLALEAGLSFLGLGVRPPQASWGSMIQDAIPYLSSAWWVAAVPCACLVITVLCAASIGDRVHERGLRGS